MTKKMAGVCSSLIYAMTLLAPIFGAVVDVYGPRLLVQTVFIALALIGFLMFYVTNITPWFLVPFSGFCFAWIEQNAYCILGRSFESLDFGASGVGCGIMGAFLNSGLMVIPPVVGGLMASYEDNRVQSIVYVISLAVALMLSLAMFAVDTKGKLNEGPAPVTLRVRACSSFTSKSDGGQILEGNPQRTYPTMTCTSAATHAVQIRTLGGSF